MDKYYTCEEVAEIYKVRVKTVYKWISDGKLHAIAIGRSYRIRQRDLEAFEKDVSK